MKRIDVTSASWKDVESKIGMVSEFEKLISNFSIDLFTENLNGIFIIFQAFPKEIPRTVKEYTIYRRKTKMLEIYLILDYDKLIASSDDQNLLHLKEVFLSGCVAHLKGLKDFKFEEFFSMVNNVLNLQD